MLLLQGERRRCRGRLGGQAGAAHGAGRVLGQPQGNALLVEVVAALWEGGDHFAIFIVRQAHCAAGALILPAPQGQAMALSLGAGRSGSNTSREGESMMHQGMVQAVHQGHSHAPLREAGKAARGQAGKGAAHAHAAELHHQSRWQSHP